MKKISDIKEAYTLADRSVDEISERIGEICSDIGMESGDIYRYRLSAEECLISLIKSGCGGNKAVIHTYRRFLSDYLEIRCEGEQHNPLSSDETGLGGGQSAILSNLGLTPAYRYENGYNVILFRLRKQQVNQLVVIAGVIALAAAVGFGDRAVLPEGSTDFILKYLLDPVYTMFFNLIRCIAGPMILLAVIWGICGIGDPKTFGKTGKKMFLTYILHVLVTTAFGFASVPLIGPSISDYAAARSVDAGDVVKLIVDIIPSNIAVPFLDGNTLQIIFLGIIAGVAILYLNNETDIISGAVEQLNSIIQLIMSYICRLIPILIFVVFVRMIWSREMSGFGSVWKLVAASLIFLAISVTVFTLFISRKLHVSPLMLARKSMPAFLIAITTASSAACFQKIIDTCQNRFGINKAMTNFGVPLGIVIDKANTGMFYLIVVLFFADQYGISCSVGWLVMAYILCTCISIAVPPVPGGGATVFMILFHQMGLPDEGLGLALAVDLVMDFCTTASEMVCMPMLLTDISDSLGYVDKEIMKKE